MSRNTPAPTEEQPQVAEPKAETAAPEITLSLDEFCRRISTKDRRVEMIGAFHHVEKAAKRIRATEPEFQKRFETFCNAPA